MTAVAQDRMAAEAAAVIAQTFTSLRTRFDALTIRAADHFANREWQTAQRDASRRLLLFQRWSDEALTRLRALMQDRLQDVDCWTRMRAAYAECIAPRRDHEIAATFFNSVTRRVFGTVGVEPRIEFLGASLDGHAPGDAPVLRARIDARDLARLLGELPLGAEWVDVNRDAQRVSAAARKGLAAAGVSAEAGAEFLTTVFYRNKGAYLVGRVVDNAIVMPVVIALLNNGKGVFVDAVLTTSDEASVVFGFSWSYFQVAVDCPRAVVRFLNSVMPLKRVDELYTNLGFHKHGKTMLYRGLLDHLRDGRVSFQRAPGQRGLVMDVIALPSFNLVLKIIRDSFGFPKRSTRREVMAHYRFVFLRDRVGRLADAQQFERLELPRTAFPDELLAELVAASPNQVHPDEERVVIRHAYTQRYVEPLDVALQSMSLPNARAAIRDYGQALVDLAHAGIFPGDMLLKNFGISRHGRVIFYDYDEIEDLDDVVFRAIPIGNELDELSDEPWYSVGEHDVFPEQFMPFLLPTGPLRDEFLATHGELLTPEWWRDVQRRLREGELFDVYPYSESLRLPKL